MTNDWTRARDARAFLASPEGQDLILESPRAALMDPRSRDAWVGIDDPSLPAGGVYYQATLRLGRYGRVVLRECQGAVTLHTVY